MAENDPMLNAISPGNYRSVDTTSRQDSANEGAGEGYVTFAGKLALNIVLHTLVTGFTVFIISLSFVDPIRLFTFHPIFMTTGFFFFVTNAIFTQSKYNVVSFRFHHQSRVILHWVMQSAAITLMTIGFILIILTVNAQPDKPPHFFTNHSIVGLTAYILMCVSTLGGVATLYKHKFRQIISAKWFKIGHSVFGIVTYTMGIAAICLALFTHWFEKYNGSSSTWTCFVIIILVWIYTISKPISGIKSRLNY